MKRRLFNLFSIISLCVMGIYSCNTNKARDFEWDQNIAQLTGSDLNSWLRRAPFENELQINGEDEIVFTNAEEVFPFMAGYFTATGELRADNSGTDTTVFQEEKVLYQDPKWGDLFVTATLLYEGQEVYLTQSYTQMGNPVFGGVAAASASYSATLRESLVHAHNKRYKTGLYWATIDFKDYLLGFYQQGQLVFQTAIPLIGTDTLSTLNKLKEVNQSLGLNIVEWENTNTGQLLVSSDPKTFWQDPFVGLYTNQTTILNDVHLKTKDTPFKMAEGNALKGDYYFSYLSPDGPVELYTEMISREESRTEAEFNQENRSKKKYINGIQEIFYEETIEGSFITGRARTYTKDSRILALNYRFPKADRQAKSVIHDVLRHVKANKY